MAAELVVRPDHDVARERQAVELDVAGLRARVPAPESNHGACGLPDGTEVAARVVAELRVDRDAAAVGGDRVHGAAGADGLAARGTARRRHQDERRGDDQEGEPHPSSVSVYPARVSP